MVQSPLSAVAEKISEVFLVAYSRRGGQRSRCTITVNRHKRVREYPLRTSSPSVVKPLIQGDVTKVADVVNVFAVAKAHFGGIEVLLRDGKWRIQASLISGGMDLSWPGALR